MLGTHNYCSNLTKYLKMPDNKESDTKMRSYSHTQRGPLLYILTVVALGIATLAIVIQGQSPTGWILGITAVVMLVLAFSFHTLTLCDDGQRLLVRYGPLPVFHTSIDYADIRQVEAGRSSVLDGWGIHYVPGRGWTYNLWGFACVIIHTGKSVTRIGTDDSENLAAFLNSKLAASQVLSDPNA